MQFCTTTEALGRDVYKRQQDAVTSVEILFQLGLLSKETFKLYYDRKDPGEENEVKDENGEALVIDIWSCVSSALSTT